MEVAFFSNLHKINKCTMKKVLFRLSFAYSIVPILWILLATKEYFPYLFSFYSLSLSFSFFLIFSSIKGEEQQLEKKQVLKQTLTSYGFLTFTFVNTIVVLAMVLDSQKGWVLSLLSIYVLYTLILLCFVNAYLSQSFKDKIGNNNLAVVINTFTLIPFFLHNKFYFFDEIFKISIFNSIIENWLFAIPFYGFIILVQIYYMRKRLA